MATRPPFRPPPRRSFIVQRSAFQESIDNRLLPEKTVRNWADDIDLSGISTNFWRGCLISPRHCTMPEHVKINWKGQQLGFKHKATGQEHIRTVVDYTTIGEIGLCTLDQDTPGHHSVLPDDYYQYIFDGSGLPVLCIDQERKYLVYNLHYVQYGKNGFTFVQSPFGGNRGRFFEEAINGDSGGPIFLVYMNEAIVLSHFWFPQGGPFYTANRIALEQAMKPYKLTDFKFLR